VSVVFFCVNSEPNKHYKRNILSKNKTYAYFSSYIIVVTNDSLKYNWFKQNLDLEKSRLAYSCGASIAQEHTCIQGVCYAGEKPLFQINSFFWTKTQQGCLKIFLIKIEATQVITRRKLKTCEPTAVSWFLRYKYPLNSIIAINLCKHLRLAQACYWHDISRFQIITTTWKTSLVRRDILAWEQTTMVLQGLLQNNPAN